MAEVAPPELQQYVAKLQQLQARLNQVAAEKSVVEAELKEVERALNVLNNASDDANIYRLAGYLMVKVSREDAQKDLSDRKDILELRLKNLEKQESLLTSEIKDLESKINEILGRYYRGKSGGAG